MALHVQHRNNLARMTGLTGATRPDSDLLCEQCRALDLDAAFSGPTLLGTRPAMLEGPGAACPLCKLFVAVGKTYSKGRVEFKQPRTQYTIESTEYRHVLGVTDKVDRLCGQRIFCLAVFPTFRGPISDIVYSDQRTSLRSAILRADTSNMMLDSKTNMFCGRVVQPGAVDYDLVTDWLKWCYDHHPDSCFRALPASMRKLRAVGMRLIDCASATIHVYQEGDSYAALSYVWGLSMPEPNWHPLPGAKLPTKVPKTIGDAMRVCQRLGIKYLWVDQYCINQQDVLDKDRQIICMKEIYAQALLALFAAAGNDPSYGLPGVSTTPRSGPQPVEIHGTTLVSSLRRPAQVIVGTVWAHRGWVSARTNKCENHLFSDILKTYQEGVLTNRRLVFTDEQILSTRTLHTLRNDVRPDYFRAHCNPERKRLGTSFARIRIWQHIVAFNRRKLTNEGDRLEAFSGILADFGVSHIVGVPIDSNTFGKKEKWTKSARISKTSEHEVSFVASLCWHTNFIRSQKSIVLQKRRPGLPSFSWIGWSGQINYELIRNAFGRRGKHEIIYHSLVRFPIFDTKSWRQPNFTDRAKEGLFCVGETMEIWIRSTVPCSTIALLSIRSNRDHTKQLEFPRAFFRLSSPKMGREYNETARADLPAYHVMVDGCYDALVLMDFLKERMISKTYLLLFERHVGYVERVGLLELLDYEKHIARFKTWPTKRETLLLK